MIRHFKSSVFGVTWVATLIWFIVFLIGEGIAVKTKRCKDDQSTQFKNASTIFNLDCEFVNRLTNEENTTEFKNFEANMKKVLTFFLGFFVTTSIKRWWYQTSKIPRLTDLAVISAAIFQPGDKPGAEEKCKKTIRDLLRLCALSYSIVMLSISSCQKDATTKDEIIQILKDKKLASEEELKKLGFLKADLGEDYFTSTGGAMQVWYLPLIWASRIVQKEQLKDGYLPKEGKEIAKNLGKFKYDLEHVAEFTQRPLPAIAIQALNFVFWATLIVGTLDNSHKFMDAGWYYMPLDFIFHIDELIVYILLYAWLKMAKIVTNPFDGDRHYDIDVIERIDLELFEATVAINI